MYSIMFRDAIIEIERDLSNTIKNQFPVLNPVGPPCIGSLGSGLIIWDSEKNHMVHEKTNYSHELKSHENMAECPPCAGRRSSGVPRGRPRPRRRGGGRRPRRRPAARGRSAWRTTPRTSCRRSPRPTVQGAPTELDSGN